MDTDERLVVRLNKAAELYREAAAEIFRLETVIETLKCGHRMIAKSDAADPAYSRYEAAETLRVAERVARGE